MDSSPENALSIPKDAALADIERLAGFAQELADASLSPATRRCYRADWRAWVKWCDERGMDPLGPSGQLALYIAHLVEQGAKISTIERAISAISKAYTVAERPNPRQDQAVKVVYRGARRRVGVAPEQVAAVLPSGLRAMVEALPSGPHHDLRSSRNRALLVVGFAGGFRRSELLALERSDLEKVPEGFRVKIRRSKTDQEGRGRVLGLPYGSVLAICPVRALEAWLSLAGIESGPVFRSISFDGRTVLDTRLSDRQFADVVKTAAKRAGLDGGRYAGHSLRAGLVSAAVSAKKNPRAIMQQTGHKTVEMVMRYVREQEVFDDNAAAGLL